MNLKVTGTEEQITTLEIIIGIIKNCNPFYKSCIIDDFCAKSLFIDIYICIIFVSHIKIS